MNFEIIPFFLNLFDTFSETALAVMDFLSKEFDVFGETYTVFEMIFGPIILTIIGYWIIKFFIPI